MKNGTANGAAKESSKFASGLVGRCFHIYNEDRIANMQGIVRAQLEDGFYLVQYFDAMHGLPSTLAVVHISTMVQHEDRRGPGDWQFYEDDEHLRDWWECYGKYQFKHAMDEKCAKENAEAAE
jgi:hypothetical protein